MSWRHVGRALSLCAGAAVLAQPALGEPRASETRVAADRWAMQQLASFAWSREEWITLDEVRARATPLFDNADLDGGGISQADYDLSDVVRNALQRSGHIQSILRDDLNGDGRVTRAEFTQAHYREARRPIMSSGVRIEPSEAQVAQVLDQIVERGMKADTNRDDVIDWSEMVADARARVDLGHPSAPREPALLILDGNGDGTVTKVEFMRVLERAFDTADADRDGRLSREERGKIQPMANQFLREQREADRARRQIELTEAAATKCAIPKPPPTSKLVFVSAYEGQGVSTVALGGEDKEVTIARVTIEPGVEPLSLALTSHTANIWLVDGEVGRVVQVVLGAGSGDKRGTPRAGVVGVPREKVRVARSTDCLRYVESRAKAMPTSESARVKLMLGRAPDLVFAEYGLAGIGVPSGKRNTASPYPGVVQPRAGSQAADVWQLMLKYNPMGLIAIDPATVMADVKVARFTTLPQEAGLAQLVESGALEIVGHVQEVEIGGTRVALGEGDRVGGAAPQQLEAYSVPSHYLVKKQFVYPAGLAGAHSVTFVVPAGAPEPLGSPGHSRVLRQ